MNTGFREVFQPLAARLPRIVREQEVLRLAASLTCTPGFNEIPEVRRKVLTWVQNRAGSRLPDAAWRGEDFDHLAGGRNSAAVRLQHEDTDIWAVRAEDPDKTIPGRTWITEFAFGRSGKAMPRLGLRLFVSTQETKLEIEPHTPGFMQQIVSACELCCGPNAVVDKAILIDDAEAVEGLLELLLDGERRLPVFVLSTLEGSDASPLDADMLARATLGLASVIVLPARFTWKLTERFGRRHSVFGGGVRVYLPGFTVDGDAYAHRLELYEKLTAPGGLARCQAWMRALAAEYSLRHLSLGRDVLDFKAVRDSSLKVEQERLTVTNASDSEKLEAALRRIDGLERQKEELAFELEYFDMEHKKAEQRALDAERQLGSLRYAAQQLADQSRGRNTENVAEECAPSAWKDVADWSDRVLAGRLLLTQTARRGLRAPEFQDLPCCHSKLAMAGWSLP